MPAFAFGPARPALVVLAVTVVTVVLTLGGAGGGALLGFDVYPLIAASKVDSIGSLVGTFGEELMDGRYPDGHFYRPLVHLSFAFDHALGGLAARPYFVTDLAILTISAWLIGLLAARFVGTGERARLAAGIAAALLFVLHRAQLDVVPYTARRADGLCVLFIAASAYAAARGARPWVAGMLALCAFLSKETGVIALPIAFAAVFARDGMNARLAARALLVPAIAVALGIALRTAVLGGLGGHAESGATGFADAGPIARGLLHAVTAEAVGGPWVVLALLLGTSVPLLLGTRSTRAAFGLGAAWCVSALAITLLSGRFHDWYAMALLPGMAIAAGVAVGRACGDRCPTNLLPGLAASALIVIFAAASMGSAQRDALRVAQSIAADQTSRFQTLIAPLGPGDQASFSPWVIAVQAAPGTPPIFVHAPYSLTALGDLTLEGTPVVALGPEQPGGSQPTSITVRLVPGPPPAAALAARNP